MVLNKSGEAKPRFPATKETGAARYQPFVRFPSSKA
jgi:hypothetical protein